MDVLLLGGTSFVGRAIAEHLLAAGRHDLTLFGRGRTGTGLFPGVKRLRGDRDSDHKALRGSEFDAVIDVSGYQLHQVTGAMAAIKSANGYLFISSHAVYEHGPHIPPGNDESTPRRPALAHADVLTNDTYGRCKVACEDAVLERFGDRGIVVRPGRVAGPHDNQGAFTHWVNAVSKQCVKLPADPDQPVQVIDVRDLAALVVRLLEDGRSGVFNAVGVEMTLANLIHTCAEAVGTDIKIIREPDIPGIPLARPRDEWTTQQRSAAKAYAAGMPATPLLRTARDVLSWLRQ